MKQPLTFFRLDLSQQILYIEALFWLVFIRLILWMLPYRIWRRLLFPDRNSHKQLINDSQKLESIPYAIRRMSRLVPAATCLTQALAAQRMYRWRQQFSELKIGVVLNEHGEMDAHAWLEVEGAVVVGSRKDLIRYSTLTIKRREADHKETPQT